MRNKIMALFLTGALSLTLFACQGNDEKKAKDAAENDAATKEITFALDWTPNTNHTGLYIAQEKGYFADEGLSIKLVQPPQNSAEALVASGGAEFGMAFQDTVAPGWAEDDPLAVTAVAAVMQHNTSGILSSKDLNITRPKDMEGHKYATWNLPIEQSIVEYCVNKDGGDFNQVEMIPNTVTDEPSALSTGEVDMIWAFYAAGGIACEKADVDTNFFLFRDIDPIFDYYTPVIVAQNTFLEKEPDTARAFLRAVEKGYRFAIEHPEEAAEIMLQANPELSEDLLKASQAWISPEYQAEAEKWGYIDAARWNGFYQWLYEEGLIEKEIPDDFGFDNQYLPE